MARALLRVAVAEPHARTRQALRLLLSGALGVELAGCATDRPAALEAAGAPPDVLLLSFGLIPWGVAPPPTLTIAVGIDDEPGFRARAMEHGAVDYVCLSDAADTLVPVLGARVREAAAVA